MFAARAGPATLAAMDASPVLALERCVLRPWRAGDERALARHANDREVWRNLRDSFPHPYTEDHARAWIELRGRAEAPAQYAIEVGGEPVGGIGLQGRSDVHRLTAEIGYWLGREVWGRGIATEAVRAVSAHALGALGLARVEAQVFAWNPASMRVLEKCGFVREGWLRASAVKDGELIDAALYARVRGDARR